LRACTAEDHLPALHVGRIDHDLPVEAARPEERRIQHVGAVRRGEKDDSLVGLEPVHFDEELVERLLALVVAAAQPRAPVATDGVDLVDEDDAGCMGLALLEEVAHPRRSDTHEHLDEVRARHLEEGTPGLPGDRLRHERLSGSRRSDQQHALREPASQSGELLRVLQEVDDLLEFVLRLFGARHVGEGHLRECRARSAWPWTSRTGRPCCHLPACFGGSRSSR
jgi:hypothetical protein